MKPHLFTFSCALFLLRPVRSQNLQAATESDPNLSSFNSLLTENNDVAAAFSTIRDATVLVPNNQAFIDYSSQNNGARIEDLSVNLLLYQLQYHTVNETLTASQLASASQGRIAGTLLKDDQYNHRASPSGAQQQPEGQVLFITAAQGAGGETAPGKRFVVKRASDPGSLYAQGGVGEQVGLQAVDKAWDGGSYQIVDGFLKLPQTCTDTMQKKSLKSLEASLNRTDLADTLNNARNVTCLAPNNAAFTAAGAPHENLSTANLSQALKFHTLPLAAYASELRSGETFKSLAGESVRFTEVDGEMYFNDAKVLARNVITNNGVIHVLDRIMSPLNASTTASATSGTSTSATLGTGAPVKPASVGPGTNISTTPSAASTPQTTGTSGANPVVDMRWYWWMLALAAIMVVFA